MTGAAVAASEASTLRAARGIKFGTSYPAPSMPGESGRVAAVEGAQVDGVTIFLARRATARACRAFARARCVRSAPVMATTPIGGRGRW